MYFYYVISQMYDCFVGRYAVRYSKTIGDAIKKSIDQLPTGVVGIEICQFL